MSAAYQVQYRGFQIMARQLEVECIGSLSDYRRTTQDAVSEIKRYLDEQATPAAGDGKRATLMTLIVAATVRPRITYFWRPCCLQSRLSAPATPCV